MTGAWKYNFFKLFIDESAALRLTECAVSLPFTAYFRECAYFHIIESWLMNEQLLESG